MTDTELTSAADKLAVRTPPTFDSVADERRHRLERMAGVCRVFGRMGFSEGLLGHVTVRDPEREDRLWINPLGVSFNLIKVSDLVEADHDGNVVTGTGQVNPVGLLLHSAIHRARPDVTAVCHAHSTYASAWSAFGAPVAPITQDTAVFFDDQAIIREPRLALNPEEADKFAARLGDKRVGIHVGHGLFTTGLSVDEAAWWFIGMDKAAHVQLLARSAGEHEVWPADAAMKIRGALGSPQLGWLSFQTLWDEISQTDPDLFD